MTLRVAICGQPSSGNRALGRLLQGAMIQTGTFHGTSYEKIADQGYGNSADKLRIFNPTHALIPVRNWRWRDESAAEGPAWVNKQSAEDKRILRLMTALVGLNVPTLMLSYEGWVEEPDYHRNMLSRWLGVRIPSMKIIDGNIKRRAARRSGASRGAES